MTSGVTQATLDYLARRLNDVAAQLPTAPAEVDPTVLTDDIALACVSTGFYRHAIPGAETSHLRGDTKVLRTIAAEKCSTARTLLLAAAAQLHTEAGGRAQRPR
ncbi:hypothetical protein [Streptomyces sp. NPDC005865]|uniref:hypothetical protein n=1 Tax=Streptomyces sp. NPDC005865 TaxID=3155453 RepID=UPI00340CFE16